MHDTKDTNGVRQSSVEDRVLSNAVSTDTRREVVSDATNLRKLEELVHRRGQRGRVGVPLLLSPRLHAVLEEVAEIVLGQRRDSDPTV